MAYESSSIVLASLGPNDFPMIESAFFNSRSRITSTLLNIETTIGSTFLLFRSESTDSISVLITGLGLCHLADSTILTLENKNSELFEFLDGEQSQVN